MNTMTIAQAVQLLQRLPQDAHIDSAQLGAITLSSVENYLTVPQSQPTQLGDIVMNSASLKYLQPTADQLDEQRVDLMDECLSSIFAYVENIKTADVPFFANMILENYVDNVYDGSVFDFMLEIIQMNTGADIPSKEFRDFMGSVFAEIIFDHMSDNDVKRFHEMLMED